MIKSMTAFARKQAQGEWGTASIEIKTVNHRYLDINLRLPEMLRELEMPMRDKLRGELSRGKIDVSLRYSLGSGVTTEVALNETLLKQLIAATEKVEQCVNEPAKYDAMDILRWPGVMQVADADLTETKQQVLNLVSEALLELSSVRQREGEALAKCILQRIDDIEQSIQQVIPRTQEIVAQQRKKLQQKVADLKVELDSDRLEHEIILIAQRIDVAEELDRLNTHIKEVRRVIKKGGVVGRRLDFLMQEFNREANTLASKSIDSDMTQAAVEIKVFIEQMREQIQNIE